MLGGDGDDLSLVGLRRPPRTPRAARGLALAGSWSQSEALGLRENARRAGDDALRDLRDAFCGRDVSRELEQRRRALGLTALGLVQPRVLERDGRVSGQNLEHAEIVAVELVQPELRDDDDARSRASRT